MPQTPKLLAEWANPANGPTKNTGFTLYAPPTGASAVVNRVTFNANVGAIATNQGTSWTLSLYVVPAEYNPADPNGKGRGLVYRSVAINTSLATYMAMVEKLSIGPGQKLVGQLDNDATVAGILNISVLGLEITP